jgi:hypothetical protein
MTASRMRGRVLNGIRPRSAVMSESAGIGELDLALAAMLTTMTIAIVWIIAYQWRRARVAAYNARLKQLMIERGMSASEIERVLNADGASDRGKRPHAPGVAGIGCALDTDCCAGDANMRRG